MLRVLIASMILLIVMLALWVITDGDAAPDIDGFGLAERIEQIEQAGKNNDDAPTRPPSSVVTDRTAEGLHVVVQVITRHGTGVAGAMVEFVPAPESTPLVVRDAVEPLLATADDDGIVRLTVPHSGRWRIDAVSEGFARVGRIVELHPGAARRPVLLTLEVRETLRGRVFDATGRGVVNAKLSAYVGDERETPLETLLSGSSGNFEFKALRRGVISVWGARPGDPPTRLARVRIPNVERLQVLLREPDSLRGTVRSIQSGRPIANAEVTLRFADGVRGAIVTSTDREGRYQFGGLPAGARVRLTVSVPSYLTATAPGPASWETLGGGTGHVMEVALWASSGSVTGSVQDVRGKPLSGVLVRLLGVNNLGGILERSTRTGSTGTYTASGLPDGDYAVFSMGHSSFTRGLPPLPSPLTDATAASFVRRVAAMSLMARVRGKEPVPLDLVQQPGGRISGQVVSPQGTPVEGARVVCSTWPDKIAVTGRDGRFDLGGVPASSNVSIVAEHPDFSPIAVAELSVRVAEATDAGRLQLGSLITVRGQLATSDGEHLRGAEVWVDHEPPSGTGLWSAAIGHAVRGEQPFELRVPRVGKWVRVRATANGYSPAEFGSIDVDAGGVVEIGPLTLIPLVRLRGLVEDVDGEPISGAQAGVQTETGWEVAAVTTGDGRFTAAVSPGERARLEVRASDYLSESGLEFGEGDATRIELRRAIAFRGRILHPVGGPLVGLSLELQSSVDVQDIRSARTDSAGAFAFVGLSPGKWLLRGAAVHRRDGAFRVAPVDVSLPAEATEWTAQETGVITGRVVDDRGSPVGGLLVEARSGDTTQTATTRPDGSFRVIGVDEGRVWDLSAGRWGTAFVPGVRKAVGAGTEGVELAVQPGLSLELRCTDEAGSPLPLSAEDRIGVTATSDGMWARFAGTGMSTLLEGLRAGKAFVHVIPGPRSSFLQASVRIELPLEETLVVSLRNAAFVGGVVLDPRGAPIAGAEVRVHPAGTPLARGHWPRGSGASKTDASGRFRVRGLPSSGMFRVVVTGGEGFGVHVAEAVKPDTADMRVQLAAGRTVTGCLKDASGEAVPNETVAILDTSGRLMAWSETSADGTFRLHGLPARSLRVVVRLASKPDHDIAVGPLPSESSELDLRLP